MRKVPVLAALVAGGLSFGAFSAVQADVAPAGGGEGCIAHSPVPAAPPAGNIVYAGACNYVATRNAGYATAAQGWTVKVWTNSAAKAQGLAPVRSASSAGSKPCNVSGFIVPGNYVEVTATNGVAAAGNPFPSGSPDTTTDYCTSFPV